MKRTVYCGQVRPDHVGQTLVLAGWVHNRRDHGGVLFIDLRDREGLVQLVFHPERKEVFSQGEGLRGEFVIEVAGEVNPVRWAPKTQTFPPGLWKFGWSP